MPAPLRSLLRLRVQRFQSTRQSTTERPFSTSPRTLNHQPVLLKEVLEQLSPQSGGWYLDTTFGEGGYSKALLDRCDCKVMAIDQDPFAIEKAQALADRPEYRGRLRPILGRFSDIRRLAVETFQSSEPHFSGIVYDIGICSSQVDDPSRGFSYLKDGPLDMRMASKGSLEKDEDAIKQRVGRRTIPASVVVNNFSVDQMAHLFRVYGEEKFATRIAQEIDAARQQQMISTTQQLAEVVYRAVPHSLRQLSRDNKTWRNPAARVFQSLRIYVNDELGELQRSLQDAYDLVTPGGRVVVVTFHSLEDALVKRAFLERQNGSTLEDNTGSPDTAPPSYTVLTRKVIKPTSDECAHNPRARSAKMRVIQRAPEESPVN
ncbi:ribosomal RNA small subunit methyltransferase H [Dimargaris cristalligena]|uniref:Ribosomal RNA small subunit methyltransferase H n=1 Tax=Dimargaris cristalligena TaxID=215637 RepID=A0A4P9ZXW3_9FUNG|nr:ribosomal RNA small subunit methyltransferase H [Dimargaris cristalligena]|eukprot:RKP38218.1 ribosomal RNA small subunit methyltransferase H [Dimargaris cristalligena]